MATLRGVVGTCISLAMIDVDDENWSGTIDDGVVVVAAAAVVGALFVADVVVVGGTADAASVTCAALSTYSFILIW